MPELSTQTDNNSQLVSVILPTYNRKDLIGKSIQSVLAQSFDKFELIVVDDASTDSTEEVVKGFSDPRVVYLKHLENKGGAAARNTGINTAKGEFIAFQDSDDIWLPEKLAKQMAVFEDSPAEVGVVYCECSRWEGSQERQLPGNHLKTKNGNLYSVLLLGNFITLPSIVFKKVCLEKVGSFDETLPRLQDWELFLRISKYFEFRYVPEPLVQSFFTEGSISSKPEALIEAVELILRKNLQEFKKQPPIYSGQLLGLSNLYRQAGDIKKSRHYLIKAAKAHYRPGLFLAIMASFLGLSCFNAYWRLVERTLGPKEQ